MMIEDSIRLLEDYHEWEMQHGLDGSGVDEATNKLLEVAKKYQKIKEIINNTNGIQEDVIRYKMICDVLKEQTNE